jgi:DNA replication protein DnaC
MFVNEDDVCLFPWDVDKIYDSKSDFSWPNRQLKDNCHYLQNMDIIEAKKSDDLANRDMYCITDDAKQVLFAELQLDLKEAFKPKNIILAKDITEKPLYYNPREQGQIDQLVKLLDGDNFAKVQRRLAKNGMRKGFACLFYGAPGTGKTETVYQIARRTGRDILYVNVSEIKSMWVGESEKNIKSLFDKYRNFCKQSAATPILLFNEADAVLGVRQQGAERAADKMENSIQNIILQEMETLDGIMIATTNLTQNLDPAFERRFLFKIEFDKPGIEAKTSIWRSMIPELSESVAAELAGNYQFSGGQIENIARKRTVDHIIQGKRPTLTQIHEYCKSEQINNNKNRRLIGFNRS